MAFASQAFGASEDDQLTPEVVLSLTNIGSESLGLVGQSPLVTIDDDTLAASQVRLYLETAIRFVLRDHFWNFATYRAPLTEDTVVPVFGWSHAYFLPDGSDVLYPSWVRIESVNEDKNASWAIEAGRLLTNDTVVYIKYIGLSINPTFWDPMFRQAEVIYLAYLLAGPLTSKLDLGANLLQRYELTISEARTVDGQEEGWKGSIGPTDLIDCRN